MHSVAIGVSCDLSLNKIVSFDFLGQVFIIGKCVD